MHARDLIVRMSIFGQSPLGMTVLKHEHNGSIFQNGTYAPHNYLRYTYRPVWVGFTYQSEVQITFNTHTCWSFSELRSPRFAVTAKCEAYEYKEVSGKNPIEFCCRPPFGGNTGVLMAEDGRQRRQSFSAQDLVKSFLCSMPLRPRFVV